jgi:hypothetical protein
MKAPDQNKKNQLPEWQAEKMKTLIEERWSEVWQIVMARERSTRNLRQH